MIIAAHDGKVKVALVAGLTLVAVTFAILNAKGAHATASTLSLTLGSNTASVNVAPFNSNGVFGKSSNVSIAASTDNATGYTLSIAASNATDYDKLKNGNGDACDNAGSNANSVSGNVSSNCFNSINAAVSEATFSGLSSTGYNGLWGYLPSKYNSVANTDFRPAPDTNGDILDVTSAANSSANNYSLAVGARVDSTMAINSYSNVYVVQLVGNAVPYAIVYDDGIVGNMPTDVAGDTANATVAIENRTPTRAGYKFLGWCTVALPDNSAISDCATNGGAAYQPNGSITLDQVTPGNNEFHLYAVWAEVKTIVNAGTMQAVSSKTDGGCPATLTAGQVYELTDSRDQTTYHVARLVDGNCWMLDNLALDVVAKIDDMNETNTNASNTTLGYLKNGGGSTTSGDVTYKYASAGVANWTIGYSYSAPLVNMSYKDTVPSNAPTNGQGNNKIGGYYNYCAASAGSYCYGDGTSYGIGAANAPEDICPKGWRLPTSYASGEFSALANAIYGSTGSTSDATAVSNYRNALSLLLSGFLYNGSARSQGSEGYWWSSTRGVSSYMYYMKATDSNVNPADMNDRTYGYSIRCILGG